jgi:hypothetical protein
LARGGGGAGADWPEKGLFWEAKVTIFLRCKWLDINNLRKNPKKTKKKPKKLVVK